jgi:hypothetical protein
MNEKMCHRNYSSEKMHPAGTARFSGDATLPHPQIFWRGQNTTGPDFFWTRQNTTTPDFLETSEYHTPRFSGNVTIPIAGTERELSQGILFTITL